MLAAWPGLLPYGTFSFPELHRLSKAQLGPTHVLVIHMAQLRFRQANQTRNEFSVFKKYMKY
jgi:hypothetical protein